MNTKVLTQEKIQIIRDLESDLLRWKGQSVENAHDALQVVRQPLEYTLRMVWLGRFDKMSVEKRKVLDAATWLYLPDQGYTGAEPMTATMRDKNHNHLSWEMVDALWQDYLDGDHGLEKPPVPVVKRSFWDKLFKRQPTAKRKRKFPDTAI